MHSDSDMDEDLAIGEAVAGPTSPLPKSLSELSLSATSEQAAQEAYDVALADYTIYNLIRIFATATRALAMYDCKGCLEELEKLPPNHQRSAWVMAMVGKSHYELGEYSAVSNLDVPICVPLRRHACPCTRPSALSRRFVTWNLIGSGIWKYIPLCSGINNGVTIYHFWRKSYFPLTLDRRRRG